MRNKQEHALQLTNEIITAQTESISADGTHLFWTSNPSESLTKSISEIGQAAPILVCETDKGLTLIAGHARLIALTTAQKPVLARIVTDVSNVDLGLLYMADNAHRSLDDGMRLKALHFFAPFMDEKSLKKDILPRLGVKPKSKDARLLLSWLTMDASWQALLVSGNVPLAAVTPLGRMNAEERASVEPLFTNFSWSRSNAVNMLNWLFETARMTGQPISAVMKEAGMDAILSQGLSPKDAIARLSAVARQARYPELTRLQNQFTTASGEITAGTRWRMTQPNNFETGGSELTIQVKDAAQLAQAVKDLETLADSPAWDTIWTLGGQND